MLSSENPSNIFDWLVEESPDGDVRLQNYLKFSVHKKELLQDNEYLQEALTQSKSAWIEARQEGIDEGWLLIVEADNNSTKDEIDELTVVFGDYYDLDLKRRGGYALRGKNYVVLGSSQHEIKEFSDHEFNHTLLGQFDIPWLDEAVTEHISEVFKGRRHVGNLELAEHKRSKYRNSRMLLNFIVERSNGQLGAEEFTRVYSANKYDTDRILYKALERKIDAVFGIEDTLGQISRRAESLRIELMKEKGLSQGRAIEETSRLVYEALRNDFAAFFGDEPLLQRAA